jgi:hypothetical protein
MTAATRKEKKKARIFLMKAVLTPKYLISTGRVNTPTIMRVETKAAICMYPAPLCNRRAAVGNATKPGMRVIEPTMAAAIVPTQPDSIPRILEIVSGFRMEIITPVRTSTPKN